MTVKIPAWSFSSIKTFEQCPKKYYHLKVAKDFQEDQNAEHLIYGTAFHEAAEFYIRDDTPLPPQFMYAKSSLDNLKQRAGQKLCEYEMGLTEDLQPCGFKDPNVWWRGIADLLIVNGDLAYMIDYKTSKNAKYADLKQLDAMAACIFRMFPDVKRIKSALLFVVSNEFVHKEHNCDTDYLRGFRFDLERLESAIASNVWNACSGPLCGWCPVTQCVHYREPRKRR